MNVAVGVRLTIHTEELIRCRQMKSRQPPTPSSNLFPLLVSERKVRYLATFGVGLTSSSCRDSYPTSKSDISGTAIASGERLTRQLEFSNGILPSRERAERFGGSRWCIGVVRHAKCR
jgi:hypothetical protein